MCKRMQRREKATAGMGHRDYTHTHTHTHTHTREHRQKHTAGLASGKSDAPTPRRKSMRTGWMGKCAH